MNNEHITTRRTVNLSLADVTPPAGRLTGRVAPRQAATAKVVLVDIVNPQPRSSRSFYARINTPTAVKTGNGGRIKRQSVTKARI